MRIIDSNKDYYDFYQNIYRDDTFTFDRRDSFVLTKDEICRNILIKYYTPWNRLDKDNYLLLQICHTFWLLRIDILKKNKYGDKCTDYKLELLHTWKNYNKEIKLIDLKLITFTYLIKNDSSLDARVAAINNNDGVRIEHSFNKAVIYKEHKNDYIKEEKHIPILKDTGIPACVDAFDIYNALEEYFSTVKTMSERTDPDGVTDEIKITTHGFDEKISFRNRNGE